MFNQAVYLDYENVTFTFFKLPQFLVTDARFWELSSDAKVVYCVMLNRLPLSIQNGWRYNGLYYIYYSIETVMVVLHCSKSKAVRVMKELREFRLVEGTRCEDHRRMRYFFLADSGFALTEAVSSAGTGVTDEPVQEETGIMDEPVPDTGVRSEPVRSENDTCAGVRSEPEQVSPAVPNKIKSIKTDFQQDYHHQEPAQNAKRRWRWSKQEIVDDLNSLWERDTMFSDGELPALDRLIQTCAGVLSKREWFSINGRRVSCEAVHLRLMTLSNEAVGYALYYLENCPSPCSSPAAYAIAVLYNAPDEAQSYWDRKVANDLYSSKRQRVVA